MGDGVKKRGAVLRPPDGGWGWIIVLGGALSQFFFIPMIQNFTLLYKERFLELDFTSTDITTLVSVNASFGMILGVLNGPLLKIFGYRKLALAGGILYVVGNLCTGVASSYVEFIIYHGMMSSLGMIMTMAAFSMALNTYFLKKRNKAVGYTMTLTGLGPIIFPILISELLSSYGLKWTVFILAGLSLNLFVAAVVLQPVKWHMKVTEEQTEVNETLKEESIIFLPEVNSYLDLRMGRSKSLSTLFGSNTSAATHPWWSQDSLLKTLSLRPKELLEPYVDECEEDWENKKQKSVMFLDNEDYKMMMSSTLQMIEKEEISQKFLKYASEESLGVENLDNFLECKKQEEDSPAGLEGGELKEVRRGLLTRIVTFLKDVYDIDLLHDFYLINIMLGLSIALVGEIIFSSMTPFIFRDLGFGTEETAQFMSVIAGADLLCRFVAPFVGKNLKFSSRLMYLLSLFLLLLSRASMYLASSFVGYLLVSFGLGVGKGFRTVFWNLVIPDHVPLKKLPSASAFQSLLNGILLLISGPLTGAVVAINNRYTNLILASNVLTVATIILWGGEILFLRYVKKQRNQAF